MLSLCLIKQIKLTKDCELTDELVLHLALRHDAPLRSVELLAPCSQVSSLPHDAQPKRDICVSRHVQVQRLARRAEILCDRERLRHQPPGPGGQGSDTLRGGVLSKQSQIYPPWG